MVKLNAAGMLLVIVGVAILAISMIVLLTARFPTGPGSSADYQAIATMIQLGWFFIFFASFMVVMGIRRISPL